MEEEVVEDRGEAGNGAMEDGAAVDVTASAV